MGELICPRTGEGCNFETACTARIRAAENGDKETFRQAYLRRNAPEVADASAEPCLDEAAAAVSRVGQETQNPQTLRFVANALNNLDIARATGVGGQEQLPEVQRTRA